MATLTPIPIVYLPNGCPAPFLLTEEELIHLLRIDLLNIKHPGDTIRHYRERGLLRAVQVSKSVRYPLPDVLRFIERLQEENPR